MDYITGAHGFIGSHLYKRLPNAIPVPRYARAIGANGDRVFLLGTYGNRYGQNDIAEMIRVNVPREVYGRIVYVSSSSVHLEVQTPYSHTKKAAEEVLLAQGKHCIVRPYTVVGTGDHGHLIPELIESCLTGKEMDFVPWPEHDYIDVEDVVDAILTLPPGIHEVGSGVGRTNQQVRDMVEQITGKKANVRIVGGLRPYDTKNWRAPFCAARKSLEKSISEMVAAREADTGHLLQEGAVSHWVLPDGGMDYRANISC